MKERIRVLVVDDSEADLPRIADILRRAGYTPEIEVASHRTELEARLADSGPWNLVLAEFEVGDLEGLEAWEIVRSNGVDVPFILVTDRMGQERAVDAVRDGVTDCVSKSRMAFLGPAVRRALEEERRRLRQEMAEEALRLQEARYESLFREAPVALFRLDLIQVRRWLAGNGVASGEDLEGFLSTGDDRLRDAARRGIVVEGNEKALELVDPLDRVEGPLDRYAASGLEPFWEKMLHGLVSSEATRVTGEYTVRRPGGASVRVLLSAALPGGDADVTHILVAALDITPQWKLQETVEEVQRMESVGRLAGGVAHDFNNALTVIQTYASFVESALDPDDPIREDLEVILQSTRSASNLTEQLLAYGRRQVQQLEPVSLNESVRNITGILKRIIGEDIRIENELVRDLWLTEVDRSQIQQVLMNLAVNAREAMPSGGVLTFTTRNVRILRSTPDQPDLKAGEYVRIDVSDTGVGMDPETVSRVFEPFFTTKGRTGGTGLGLSTVYGIVKQSGGHIWIRSRPGHGATFEILLPRAQSAAAVDTEVEKVPGRDRSGTEHLLLVEDDDALRTATERILRKQGYSVEEADSAEGGLEIWEARRGEIQGIVTDVILPGIDGLQMVRRIRREEPGIPVLFMSGYSYEQYAGVKDLRGAVGFVRKPFTVDEFLLAVRTTLDAVSERV